MAERNRQFIGSSRPESDSTVEIAICPGCGRPRMTACPYCRTASAAFPLADRPPGEPAEEVETLLLCTTCDEPFAPEYLRRCEWCGHDFGTGADAEPAAVERHLNDRVMVVIMATAIAVIAVLFYFSSLLR